MKLLQHDISERMPTAHALVQYLDEMRTSKFEQTVPTPMPLPAGTGYLDRAAALVAERKTEEARRTAAEATLHSTGLVPALELYARLSDQLGYTDDAIEAYKKLLALENSATDTRCSAESQLADLDLRLHRYEEAERHIDAALNLPNSSRSMKFKAAVVFGACTQLEKSLTILNDMLEDSPGDGAILEKKMWVLWLLHQYDEAAHAAREALEVMPESELCLTRLADYESINGNQGRAQHYRDRLSALV